VGLVDGLDADYNFALAKVGINLVSLIKKLKSPTFFYFDVFENLQWGV
jgi:hypothetical protein